MHIKQYCYSLLDKNFIADVSSIYILSIINTSNRNTLPLLRKTESRLLLYRKALFNKRRIPLPNTHVEHVYIRCLLACLLSLRHDHHDRDEHVGGVKHTTPSYSPNMIVNVRYVSVMDSKPCIWRLDNCICQTLVKVYYVLTTALVSWNGNIYLLYTRANCASRKYNLNLSLMI